MDSWEGAEKQREMSPIWRPSIQLPFLNIVLKLRLTHAEFRQAGRDGPARSTWKQSGSHVLEVFKRQDFYPTARWFGCNIHGLTWTKRIWNPLSSLGSRLFDYGNFEHARHFEHTTCARLDVSLDQVAKRINNGFYIFTRQAGVFRQGVDDL